MNPQTFNFVQFVGLVIALLYTIITNQPLWGIVVAIIMLCGALGSIFGDKHNDH